MASRVPSRTQPTPGFMAPGASCVGGFIASLPGFAAAAAVAELEAGFGAAVRVSLVSASSLRASG